jgi:CRISPR system Cascade subunit CasC
MKNNRLYLDMHVLQTVPPSCVNRDDTGSPKTAIYGGVTRSRVSSQSWKRAMRIMFRDLFEYDDLGIRTKRIVKMVGDEIRTLDSTVDCEKLAESILITAGLKIKSVEKGTDALFFLSVAQAKALAELAISDPETIKASPSKTAKDMAKSALQKSPGVDIALFGRMVADDPTLNNDACSQVAHSISTHKVSNEYDYFTAVDDLSPDDNAGAGHIGTVEFNSSTIYRYATVAVHELEQQLNDDVAKAVGSFIRAFVCSMPTGKQNTFANRTLPDAVLVTLRKNQPVNLVGAFEKAVPPSADGYVTASAKRLVEHAESVYKNFAGKPVVSLGVGKLMSGLGIVLSFDELLNTLEDEINNILTNGGQE